MYEQTFYFVIKEVCYKRSWSAQCVKAGENTYKLGYM